MVGSLKPRVREGLSGSGRRRVGIRIRKKLSTNNIERSLDLSAGVELVEIRKSYMLKVVVV